MRFLALITAAGLTFAGISQTERTMYRYSLSVPMTKPTDGREVIGWLNQNGYDVAGLNWRQGQVEVIVDDGGIRRLHEHGFTGTRVHALQAGLQDIDAGYLNPQRVEDRLKALNAQYPDRTRLQQIGVSLQGRAIWGLLISGAPNSRVERPTMIFDGMHHAREIMTPEIVMDAGETLLAGAEDDILKRWDIWIVPMLNVDGNNLVWTKDSWWRKNARNENTDLFGVDLNRNYPYAWGTCNGSSSRRGSDSYRGAAAASEPETMALMGLAQATHPAASLSYHSYGEMVLYPYGCQDEFSGENTELEGVAKELAALLPSEGGGGNYAAGTPWQLLYSVDGDSMSYLHVEHGAVALSFEVGQDFQPSYSQRQTGVEHQRPAWRHFLKHIDQNLLSISVTDGRTGQPTLAQIDFTTVAHIHGEKPYTSSPAGNFFKVLAPGTYTMRVTLADGRQLDTEVQMNGSKALSLVVP